MSSKFRQPFPWEDATQEESELPPVDPSKFLALPSDGWSGTGSGARDGESRRRRGIEGAARALRDQSIRAGSDPGRDACLDRVRVAVDHSERRDR